MLNNKPVEMTKLRQNCPKLKIKQRVNRMKNVMKIRYNRALTKSLQLRTHWARLPARPTSGVE